MTPAAQPPGEPLSDLLLVRTALAGKRAAVRAFLERMRCIPRMIAAHNRKLGAPLGDDEVEDVVQETLLAVWRKLERYDGRAALETWIYPFCFFEYMRRLRLRRQQPRLLDDALEGSSLEPEARAEASLLELEPLLDGLQALEADLSVVLRLKHFEDLTFEEIGVRLTISPNTAKTRYYRGLEKLRGRLGKRMANDAWTSEGGSP